MIRPWLSRFPSRQQALAVVAVVGTVGVVGVGVAVSASGGSGGPTATASGTNPFPTRSGGTGATGSGPSSTSKASGSNQGGNGEGGSGDSGSSSPSGNSQSGSGDSSATNSSGATGTSSPGGGASTGSSGTGGSSGSPSSPSSPSTPVTTPTAPGYQPPPTPRTNADVDCSKAKCIALTFDDGPGPDTGRLLDLLKAQNVPATFFVLGNQAVKYPDSVRREYAEGNEVGNHTWDHKDLSKLSAAAVQDEITRGADAIAATGIPRPTLLRPPYGAVNDTVRTVAGYPFILWRVDPEDWKYPDPARVADQIVGHAKPGRIVLSHDTHATTVDAMPAVIQRLKAQGYTFVTVSTLMKGVSLQNGQSYFNRPAGP